MGILASQEKNMGWHHKRIRLILTMKSFGVRRPGRIPIAKRGPYACQKRVYQGTNCQGYTASQTLSLGERSLGSHITPCLGNSPGLDKFANHYTTTPAKLEAN